MTTLAIVGFGQHVQKNTLPALLNISSIKIKCIYVRKPEKYKLESEQIGVEFKSIYQKENRKYDYIYIATPLSTHFDLTKDFLMLGSNVICEKPITDSQSKTLELLEIAKKRELQLFEVCMYKYHKQYHHLKNIISDRYSEIRCITAKFKIPHLSDDDIRYNSSLSGGALFDVGYYPISLFIGIFGKPINIQSKVYSQKNYNVDLLGTTILDYGSFYCLAEWGIGAQYQNVVALELTETLYEYDRFFSKPSTYESNLIISSGLTTENIIIGSDDHFKNMFLDYFERPKNRNNEYPLEVIRCLEQIAKAI